MAAAQAVVPQKIWAQVIATVITAVLGGAVGAYTTLMVLQTKVEGLGDALRQLNVQIEKLQTADEAQKARLRDLESRQAVDEAIRRGGK